MEGGGRGWRVVQVAGVVGVVGRELGPARVRPARVRPARVRFVHWRVEPQPRALLRGRLGGAGAALQQQRCWCCAAAGAAL
jgi:hypothetical protein